MKVTDVLTDSSEIVAMAGAEDTAVGRAFIKAIKTIHDSEVKRLRKTGKVSDTVPREDFRYMIGVMDKMDDLLGLPAQAMAVRDAGEPAPKEIES